MAAKQIIKEAVKNPTYYGGVDNPYEVIPLESILARKAPFAANPMLFAPMR